MNGTVLTGDIYNVVVVVVVVYCLSFICYRYMFIGTETGDIICYCINNNSIIYNNSICFGSVNCIKWITVLRYNISISTILILYTNTILILYTNTILYCIILVYIGV